jgi:hypothetical protein
MSTSRNVSARTCPAAVTSEDVAYNESSGAYRTVFDPDSQLASEAVLTTAAEAASVEPLDLPPLYDAVDPDALDALLGTHAQPPSSEGLTVSFGYVGFDVEVGGGGTVVVSQNAGPDPSFGR